jgi:glycopeptide antibiotics resistance protein
MAVMVSFGIEILQLTISTVVGFPYRVFDVDDVILNTTGAALGWAGWRVTLGWFQVRKTADESSYSTHP